MKSMMKLKQLETWSNFKNISWWKNTRCSHVFLLCVQESPPEIKMTIVKRLKAYTEKDNSHWW